MKDGRAARLLLVLALAAGCGGGDDEAEPSAGQVITQTTAPPAEIGGSTEPGEEGTIDGSAIFLQNCSGCHTLADAGTTGKVGPNLDEAKPSYERALVMVRDGGGGGLGVMPKFEGTLTPEQIDAVARYVSVAAGTG
jgi:mono/diheme cytochrome c family protein